MLLCLNHAQENKDMLRILAEMEMGCNLLNNEDLWSRYIPMLWNLLYFQRPVSKQSRTNLRQGFDIEKDPILEDLNNAFGFLKALLLVLRTRERGLQYLGLPCFSFSFLSSSQHSRSAARPFGNGAFPFVQKGNEVSARASLLVFVAIVRSLCWFIENPWQSSCIYLPYLKALWEVPALQCQRIFWSGS